MKVLYIVSHPIQYQSPLLKFLGGNCKEIDLEVLFLSDHSTRKYFDSEFGRDVCWDVNLLDGFSYKFCKRVFDISEPSFFRPINPLIFFEIRQFKPDVIWVHGWNNLSIFFIIFYKLIFGCSIFIRGEARDGIKNRSRFRNFIKTLYLKLLIFPFVDKFLSIGQKNRDFYLNYGVRKDDIHFVPYAVDNSFFMSNQKSQPNGERGRLHKSFLVASKLSSRKRVLETIHAFLEANEFRFCGSSLSIAGDGILADEVLRLCEAYPTLLKFVGFVNQHEIRDFYHSADVFVLLSSDEMWGLSVNEAMASECAVLISDEVGCQIDLVRHCENGFVCSNQNFRDGFDFFLGMDSESLECFKAESLRLVSRHSFDECALGVLDALRSIERGSQ